MTSDGAASMLVPLLVLLLFTNQCCAQGARGDNNDDICSNWNETAVALEAHNKTLQSVLQEHSSCYNFEYTYFIYSPDPPTATQVQVRNGIAQNFDPTREFNSILDVMDMIHAQCIEGCAEAIAAAAAADSEGTSTSTATTRAEDGETAVQLVHQCQVQFDDATGVPTTVWVDRFSFLADEEYTYTIDNFQWVDCENDQILEPKPTTDGPSEFDDDDMCVNYQQVSTNVGLAREVWENVGASCYTYNVEKIGRLLPEFQGPFLVEVTNMNTANVVEGYQEANMDLTMDEWFDMIRTRCFDGCGSTSTSTTSDQLDQKPAYKCVVDFSSMYGYPTYIEIDQSQYVADEEDHFVLSNFTMFECGDDSLTLPPPDNGGGNPIDEEVKCSDWETVAADFATASSQLETTLASVDGQDVCYTFTYLFQGFIYPPPNPVTVQVKNGQSVTTDTDGARFENINEFMALIQSSCIDSCPGQDGPAECNVEYNNETGVPTSIYIDRSVFIADEEISYSIYDFAVVDCASLATTTVEGTPVVEEEPAETEETPVSEEPPAATEETPADTEEPTEEGEEPPNTTEESPVTNEPEATEVAPEENPKCVNYDQVSAELFVAMETWADPACYDFTIQRIGEIPDEEAGPFVVKVRNHEIVDTGGGSIDQSINSLMIMIGEKCLAGCPDGTDAAVYQCIVEFRDDGAPLRIRIDYDARTADEEEIYIISNVNIVECSAVEEVPTTEAPPEVEETTGVPPEVVDTTDAPPEVVDTTDAPPEIESTTDAPPDIEETTDAPPEVEETTDAPPETEATTNAPPEAEGTTDVPPETEAMTDAPPAAEGTTDAPPEVAEPATCIDYEQVKADLEAAQDAWPDHQCYQFNYTQGEEAVLVQVRDGVVIDDVDAQTMNELMDDFHQLCVANCPEKGAKECAATFAAEGHIVAASIKPSDAAMDEVSYQVTDFEVLDCSDLAFAEGTSSAQSLALHATWVLPVAFIMLFM